MNRVKCFDVASMVVDEATKRFFPLWDIDQENLKILENYCAAIDTISSEFDGESFEVEVDEIKMSVIIRMECRSFTIYKKEHSFYDLASRAISVGFRLVNEDFLEIEFVFPSVWKKV